MATCWHYVSSVSQAPKHEATNIIRSPVFILSFFFVLVLSCALRCTFRRGYLLVGSCSFDDVFCSLSLCIYALPRRRSSMHVLNVESRKLEYLDLCSLACTHECGGGSEVGLRWLIGCWVGLSFWRVVLHYKRRLDQLLLYGSIIIFKRSSIVRYILRRSCDTQIINKSIMIVLIMLFCWIIRIKYFRRAAWSIV